MAEKDGITSDIRSREDEYFRRKDRELVERLRQAKVADQSRHALETRSGIHDPAMLQELEELGFTPETVSLLPIVPVIQVAWAEGGVSDDERRLIVELARQRGIELDSAADRQLSAWLAEKPAEETFARATRLIGAVLERHEGHVQADDLLQHCEAIAAASGGILGFRKVSAEERALLARIAATLKGGR